MRSLLDQVLRHAVSPVTDTAIPGLSLSTLSRPGSGMPTLFAPVTCLILQGAKRVTIGDAVLQFDRARYFVASLDMPATGQILAASPARPYVAVGLALDRATIADLIAEMPRELIGRDGPSERSSFGISPVTPELLEAWGAMLALLDRPDDIANLAPMREREILYRLLRGPLGGHLCQFAQEDSRLSRIRRAIGRIRSQYDAPLRTATLADVAGMSVASFHRHFRAATGLSPLQYQKTLRLHAARRLLASGTEASSAAYAVGYESASQFSREYSRSFGLPPTRDRIDPTGMATNDAVA
jgi:AraC-like DNA-binding protein